MTDWERVRRLRQKRVPWDEIAADRKVDFRPEPGTDPGRSLRALYETRRARTGGEPSRGERGRSTGAPQRFSSLRGSRRGVWLAVGAIALVVGGVVGYLVLSPPPLTAPLVVRYCGGEGTAAHFHVLLVIETNGTQQPLPYDPSQTADIGYLDSPGFTNAQFYCSNGGIHALHTHDGSGIIHAELPSSIVSSSAVPTLGNFFTIWGEPLSPTQVWSFTGRVSATVLDSDTHATSDYSANPANIPLYYPPGGLTSNPYPIPQNWIYSGKYGTGSSGGFFDGEIIWLNVTLTAGVMLPAAGLVPVASSSFHAAAVGAHSSIVSNALAVVAVRTPRI